jgi:hypothetical protein
VGIFVVPAFAGYFMLTEEQAKQIIRIIEHLTIRKLETVGGPAIQDEYFDDLEDALKQALEECETIDQ